MVACFDGRSPIDGGQPHTRGPCRTTLSSPMGRLAGRPVRGEPAGAENPNTAPITPKSRFLGSDEDRRAAGNNDVNELFFGPMPTERLRKVGVGFSGGLFWMGDVTPLDRQGDVMGLFWRVESCHVNRLVGELCNVC